MAFLCFQTDEVVVAPSIVCLLRPFFPEQYTIMSYPMVCDHHNQTNFLMDAMRYFKQPENPLLRLELSLFHEHIQANLWIDPSLSTHKPSTRPTPQIPHM